MTTTDVDAVSARARASARDALSARDTASASARASARDTTVSERASARDIWGFVSARDRARARAMEEGGGDMDSLRSLPQSQPQPQPYPRSPDSRGANHGNGNGNGGGNGAGNGGDSGGITRTRQLFGPPRRGPRANTNK